MPEKFGKLLIGHSVTHVVDRNWEHQGNGKLLAAAEAAGFDSLISKDANMPYQQNFAGRKISFIVVKSLSQDFDDLAALAPQILQILITLAPGAVVRVSAS